MAAERALVPERLSFRREGPVFSQASATNMKTICMLTGLLLIMPGILGCSQRAPAPSRTLEEMIAAAHSPSDHEAIAAYYEREAQEAQANYEEHQASAVRYDRVAKWRTWARHCTGLAHDFKDIHEQASALAAEHRRIAEGLRAENPMPAADDANTHRLQLPGAIERNP